MNNFLKLLCEEEFYDKQEELIKELLEIENKYIEFFNNRPSKFEREDHDRLHNHWILYHDNTVVKFGFQDDSEVPEYIKAECHQAFKRIFGLNDNKI